MQVDLLRVLESKRITQLGGSEEIEVNFRLICATNKNLEKLAEEEKFREDLYYRINVFTIFLPPLRERRTDILPVAHYFIKKYSRSMSKPEKRVSPDAEKMLLSYPWPGNVRELENAIERAMVIGKKSEIYIEDLPLHLNSTDENARDNLNLSEIEKEHILKVLKETSGNVTRTASLLGIDRVTLYNKMKKYGIQR